MAFDPGKIVGFDWDDGNAKKSVDKHGVTQGEAEQVFFNDVLVVDDRAHSSDEARFHALGATNSGRLIHVTFTLRRGGTAVRIISARTMNRKERAVYDKAT